MPETAFKVHNNISSLEELDIHPVLHSDFDCSHTDKLKDLKGGPKEVDGDCYAYDCDLRSLEGAPERVGGTFSVSRNKFLKSLKGGPKEVGKDYIVVACDLRSLEGVPKEIHGNFIIRQNPNLKTLKGSPEIVHGDYAADDCGNLVSLEGAPKKIGGTLNISGCIHVTIDNILNQSDFKDFFSSIKNYNRFKTSDKTLLAFLKFLKKLSEKSKTDISIERVKLLWKTNKSLK